jgi:methionyl-tRNA formyltransferase
MQFRRCNAPECIDEVRRLNPDVNLSVSYDQILRREIRETAPLGFVNFHAGKLPYYRGRSVLNWAIINGETEVGLTAHFVDDGIDTGDIILQRVLPIGWTDTYGDVLQRVVKAFPDLVVHAAELLASGTYDRLPQSHLMGSYFSRREPGDEWLDWNTTSRDLHNKIRGIAQPAPGARTTHADAPVIIWRAYYDPSWPNYIAIPGQVVGRIPEVGVVVKTGDSVLRIELIQHQGGKPEIPTWPIGTRLSTRKSESSG